VGNKPLHLKKKSKLRKEEIIPSINNKFKILETNNSYILETNKFRIIGKSILKRLKLQFLTNILCLSPWRGFWWHQHGLCKRLRSKMYYVAEAREDLAVITANTEMFRFRSGRRLLN
jgi:hypothetical protein